MSSFGPKNLQAKFLAGLGIIVLLLGVFFAAGQYFQLSGMLDRQVHDKADLVLGQVNSVQAYVRETLRPKMYETLPEGEFIIEAMSSSFISRAVMDKLDREHANYHYRRVAQNARNPKFEVTPSEKKILDYFRQHPDQDYWEEYKVIHGQDYFIKARPVVFKASCLNCHGVPQDSPKVLLDRYGSERGFGHSENAIDGLVLVGVPVDESLAQIEEATVGYAAVYGGGMLVFFALVQLFFNRLVTDNLRRLTGKFRTLFRDEAGLRLVERLERGDEIEEVVQGLEELGDHLHEVHKRLREHSENMEQMVEARTRELKREAVERRSDVALFVNLLDGLNQSRSRREMWRQSLPLIGQRFKASTVSFQCMLASRTFYSWPVADQQPELPENWKEILVDVRPYFEPGKALIPVGSDSSSEGLLVLQWDKGLTMNEQDRDVLRALGQQLGIAMENLSALHNLLRQNDMLQAVVEGIGDPLLLMDGNCNVVLANEAARQLAESFGGAKGDPACAALMTDGAVLERCPLARALVRGTAISLERTTADERVFSISIFPISNVDADQQRCVTYIRDVTGERHMEASMRRSEKLATVGKLAAGLAHEINNPLGVIKCYAELLKNTTPGEDTSSDVDVILKHAGQAQRVLQDLLNFARPKQDEAQSMDLGKVMADSVGVYRMRAERTGTELTTHVEPDLPPVVGTPQGLEQIVANLLNNALDAVDSRMAASPGFKGRISVSVERDGEADGLLLRVTDNGAGIHKDHRNRLFDPFFTTKEVGKGTGLGLAVVYGLVREMGGLIDVDDCDGTCFTIRIPVRADTRAYRERNILAGGDDSMGDGAADNSGPETNATGTGRPAPDKLDAGKPETDAPGMNGDESHRNDINGSDSHGNDSNRNEGTDE